MVRCMSTPLTASITTTITTAFQVRKNLLADTRLQTLPYQALGAGQVRLSSESFAPTTNNLT